MHYCLKSEKTDEVNIDGILSLSKDFICKNEYKTVKEMTLYWKAWSFVTCPLTLRVGTIYQIGLKSFQECTGAMVCITDQFIQVLDSPLGE